MFMMMIVMIVIMKIQDLEFHIRIILYYFDDIQMELNETWHPQKVFQSQLQ